MRVAPEIVLTEDERVELTKLSQSRLTSVRLAQRAQVVLLAAKGMGAHHPVAWYHRYDGGRVFVTALGHTPALYDDPLYLEHLYGGLWWAATGLGIDEPR